MWEGLVSRLAVVVMLGPEMLELYRRTLMKELSKALRSLPMVEEVNNLQCSFPAVPSEAPRPKLLHWCGDFSEPMEWSVEWASASWSVSLSVSGRLYGLGFSLDLRLHHFGVRGRLRVSLPGGNSGDLSQIYISFAELPEVDFAVDSHVAWGIVPLPVRSQVDAKVRSSIAQALRAEMVEPSQLCLKLPGLRPKRRLTEHDVQQAILDAELAKKQLEDGKTPRATWD